MAEEVIREMVGRRADVSAVDAANVLMRLRGEVWPAHRPAGTLHPTPFDPFAAPSPVEAERDALRERLAEAIEAVKRHAAVAAAFGADAADTLDRATAAEADAARLQKLAAQAFVSVCEARGFEALCGNPTGLAHHLIAAGQALAEIIAPAALSHRGAAPDPAPTTTHQEKTDGRG